MKEIEIAVPDSKYKKFYKYIVNDYISCHWKKSSGPAINFDLHKNLTSNESKPDYWMWEWRWITTA